MNSDDEIIESRLLSPDELQSRAQEVAETVVNQCEETMSGPFIVLSSMAVCLSAAAGLAAIGRIEPDNAVKIFRELLEAHYETARKDAN